MTNKKSIHGSFERRPEASCLCGEKKGFLKKSSSQGLVSSGLLNAITASDAVSMPANLFSTTRRDFPIVLRLSSVFSLSFDSLLVMSQGALITQVGGHASSQVIGPVC